jgi:thioredoxin-related protein
MLTWTGGARPTLALVCACFVGFAAVSRADDAEKGKPKEKNPALYDPKLDAQDQVDTAVAKAKAERRRVLVMFGFQTCSWCHKLQNLFEEKSELRRILRDEYILVHVDRAAPHAEELLAKCTAVLSKEEREREHGVGYPFLAVLDGDGKVVTAQRTDALEEGKGHNPEKVKAFLKEWVVKR